MNASPRDILLGLLALYLFMDLMLVFGVKARQSMMSALKTLSNEQLAMVVGVSVLGAGLLTWYLVANPKMFA